MIGTGEFEPQQKRSGGRVVRQENPLRLEPSYMRGEEGSSRLALMEGGHLKITTFPYSGKRSP